MENTGMESNLEISVTGNQVHSGMDERLVVGGSSFSYSLFHKDLSDDIYTVSVSDSCSWVRLWNLLFHVLSYLLFYEFHRPCSSGIHCILWIYLDNLFCYFYLLGYVYQKYRDLTGKSIVENGALYKKITLITVVIAVVLLVGQGLNGNLRNCTTAKAVRELESGEAQAYGQEYQKRLEVLNDESVQDVVLSPFEHTPDMLFVGDLQDDPNASVNQKVAQFYGKKSVVVDWNMR